MLIVPHWLRKWFVIHFAVDILLGLPLLFFPTWFLGLLGLPAETLMARLVGAALIAIGGASFLAYKRDVETYSIMLKIKIIWASIAILGLLIAVFSGAPAITWAIIGFFAVFLAIWIYYKIRYRKG